MSLFGQLGAARDRDALAASLLPALRQAGAPLFELPPAPDGPTPTALLRGKEATLLLLDLLAYQVSEPAAQPAVAGAEGPSHRRESHAAVEGRDRFREVRR